MSTTNQSKSITTRSGFLFRVRPVQPTDQPALAEFFKHVTPEDLRFRFLSSVKAVGAEQLFALTHVDHHSSENFIAFLDDESEIIASAMLACDSGLERGEVAISVRSDFRNEGIGWEMLAHVAAQAEAMGVKTLESIESRDNHAAIDLERDMGFTSTAYPGDNSLLLLQRKLG
ncbi:MAG: GNAT family N-acetyltransferase [Sphingorhabdus sp.]